MFSVLVYDNKFVLAKMCAFITQKALKVTSESINVAKFSWEGEGGGACPQTPLASAHCMCASTADSPYHFLCASDGPGM